MSSENNFLEQYAGTDKITIVEFMKIWKYYDKDCSGTLDTDDDNNEFELFVKDFLGVLLGDKVSDAEVKDITNYFLENHDKNKDRRFDLNEMLEILPVEDNLLTSFKGTLSEQDFNDVFSHYDADGNGKIQEEELNGFVKDLMTRGKTEEDNPLWKELEKFKMELLQVADTDGDGMLDKTELKMYFKKYLKN